MWKDFPQKLSQKTGCGALVYSRLGYGKSENCELPRPLNFMHKEGLEVLPQIITRCRINNYILVGHSDGASISLIHAGSDSNKKLLGLLMKHHMFLVKQSQFLLSKNYELIIIQVICGNVSRNIIKTLTQLSMDGQMYGLMMNFLNGTLNHFYLELRFRN